MLENRRITEGDALQAARRQLSHAEEAQQAASLEAPVHHGADGGQPIRGATLTVDAALRSADALTRGSVQQLLLDVSKTLKTVADRKRQVDTMMMQLLRETREIRRRKRRRIASRVIVVTLLIALVCWTNGHFLNFWWVFFGGGGALAADERVGKRREAVQALYTAGEPRAVGVLAIAVRDGDYTVQRVAEQALRDLLPRVRASDAAYIDREQMDALLALADQNAINMQMVSRSAHMQTALLKALEQIGDERAIPAVESLAANGATTAVRRLASECLPHLAERIRLAHEQATLLRGSASPSIAAAPAQLLRPASGAKIMPTEQLLRPTYEPEKGNV